MADGISGLKWQGVLKECLTRAVNRLQMLEEKMKKDYTLKVRQENKIWTKHANKLSIPLYQLLYNYYIICFLLLFDIYIFSKET